MSQTPKYEYKHNYDKLTEIKRDLADNGKMSRDQLNWLIAHADEYKTNLVIGWEGWQIATVRWNPTTNQYQSDGDGRLLETLRHGGGPTGMLPPAPSPADLPSEPRRDQPHSTFDPKAGP